MYARGVANVTVQWVFCRPSERVPRTHIGLFVPNAHFYRRSAIYLRNSLSLCDLLFVLFVCRMFAKMSETIINPLLFCLLLECCDV